MINKSVFCDHWQHLSNDEILQLFDTLPKTTIMPNLQVVFALKEARIATLELLEDRTFSTVYRVRQTDQVFQIFQPDGKTFEYDTFSYETEKPIDELKRAYVTKSPVFRIVSNVNDKVTIEHLKMPRFVAVFEKGNFLEKELEWIDPPGTDVMAVAKLMRKVGAFYSSYIS